MTYKIEKFVQTVKTSSAIGEGNVYEWRPVDGDFNNFSNAMLYAKSLITDHFISGYRISDQTGNKWSVQ